MLKCKEDDFEVMTTPPEEAEMRENPNEMKRLLTHMSTTNTPFVVHDRTGLRLSFAGLLPITTGDNGEQRIWSSSIILNSAELEYPEVKYKLRVSVKKKFDPKLSCNRNKGTIKRNDVFVLTYQLPESSIEAVRLTLIVDGNPHEIPLCKYKKADYYWLGKETNVPGPTELLRERNVSPNTASTIKNVSPGRMIDLPEGLKNFVIGENGLESICKLLHPHAVSLFRDLSEMQISQCDMKGLVESGNSMDMIVEEIVKRFHDENRQKFTTTPALLQ